MQNVEKWSPSKFEQARDGSWRGSRLHVGIGSRLIVDRVADAYASAISSHAKGRLADLGCGRVPLYEMYRPYVGEIDCIDWPDSSHGSLHVDFFADLNEPLALPLDGYETILATDVIEHLHTPQALFDSAAKALKAGGKLIVGVPFLYWIHEAPHDYHRYTRFALERMAVKAGLSILEIKPLGGAPEAIVDIATKALAAHPRLATAVYLMLSGTLSWRLVRSISEKTRNSMPMAYVMVAQRPIDANGPK